jgi:hypothetical protein
MKKLVAILGVLILTNLVSADVFYNGSNDSTLNDTNDTGPDYLDKIGNMTEKFRNDTRTGVGPIDQAVDFLIDASPFLLLIAGVLLIIFSGFAKIIGIIIVILAIIRIAWVLLV